MLPAWEPGQDRPAQADPAVVPRRTVYSERCGRELYIVVTPYATERCRIPRCIPFRDAICGVWGWSPLQDGYQGDSVWKALGRPDWPTEAELAAVRERERLERHGPDRRDAAVESLATNRPVPISD